MKVYVVMIYAIEETSIKGVFIDKDRAVEFAKSYGVHDPGLPWSSKSWSADVLVWDAATSEHIDDLDLYKEP